MKKLLTLVLLPVLIPLVSAQSAVITYQQGATNDFVSNYSGTSDTILASTSSVNNTNYGGEEFILVGRNEQRYSILRFDLSSMAGEYAAISSASLTLTRPQTANPTLNDFDIQVYSLLGINGGWNEMQATWINQNLSTPTPWKNAGGSNQSNMLGGRGSLLQTIDYTTTTTSITIDIPVSMILEWINSPNSSASLALVPLGSGGNNANSATFGSSENATAASRPSLTINYTPIPEPSSLVLGLLSGGVILVCWRRRSRVK